MAAAAGIKTLGALRSRRHPHALQVIMVSLTDPTPAALGRMARARHLPLAGRR